MELLQEIEIAIEDLKKACDYLRQLLEINA